MDDYYQKYARPLGKMNIFEVKQNLARWRDNLREELESLIYIRNCLSKDNLNSKLEIYDIRNRTKCEE